MRSVQHATLAAGVVGSRDTASQSSAQGSRSMMTLRRMTSCRRGACHQAELRVAGDGVQESHHDQQRRHRAADGGGNRSDAQGRRAA
jgi:hypothetical protein